MSSFEHSPPIFFLVPFIYLFEIIYFFSARVVFSVLQCITWHYPSKFELQHISWKQFAPESNCQADKTFLLFVYFEMFLFFFQHPKYTRRPNCWHVCKEGRGRREGMRGDRGVGRDGAKEGGGGRHRVSCILSCKKKTLHIVYLKTAEHFSTIKKHVIS